MRNWIIVLLIFVIPLGVFAWLEASSRENTKAYANETKISHSVEGTGKPRLLKFSSPMCSDCKKVSKEMINVIPDFKDSVTFEEINVSDGSDESAAKIETYKVTVVPTLVFISKDGKIIQKTEGFLTEKEIRTSLNNIK